MGLRRVKKSFLFKKITDFEVYALIRHIFIVLYFQAKFTVCCKYFHTLQPVVQLT